MKALLHCLSRFYGRTGEVLMGFGSGFFGSIKVSSQVKKLIIDTGIPLNAKDRFISAIPGPFWEAVLRIEHFHLEAFATPEFGNRSIIRDQLPHWV